MSKKIHSKCPICNGQLEAIQDNENPIYVDNWHCNECGLDWNYGDLEHDDIQKSVMDYLEQGDNKWYSITKLSVLNVAILYW